MLDAPSPPEVSVESPLTLATPCTCGHPRKDHRGLRIDVCGACLECDCQEFAQVNDTLERLRAAVAQAERLQETASILRARFTREREAAPQPPSNNGNGHI